MDVHLLLVDDCPHAAAMAALLRTALDDLGLKRVTFRTTTIASQSEAEANGFVGSPTVLLDGHDPFEVPDARPGLACRVYVTPEGPAGTPTLSALRQALKGAAQAANTRI